MPHPTPNDEGRRSWWRNPNLASGVALMAMEAALRELLRLLGQALG